MNICSPTLKDGGGLYYTYCPRVDSKMCNTKSNDLSLEATRDIQAFKWQNLHWSDKSGGWKNNKFSKPAYEACWYQVYLPLDKYSNEGKLEISITKMADELDMWLYTGKTIRDENIESIIPKGKTVEKEDINKWFEIEIDKRFFIIVKPKFKDAK